MTNVNITAVEASEPGPEPEPEAFRSESPSPPPVPSPLAGLKAKLATVRDELYLDLEVPRWDALPPSGRGMGLKVWVRYRPVAPSEASAISERFQKIGARDWATQTNAQILADCCIGVYAILPGDETQYSLREGDPTGAWTRMDPDLAAMLGPALVTDGRTAVGVCRALYVTEGDLTSAAFQLAEWSSKASEKADKGFPRP